MKMKTLETRYIKTRINPMNMKINVYDSDEHGEHVFPEKE